MQQESIKTLKAITHQKRIIIINKIRENNGNLCYHNLVEQSKIAPATLNFHLKKLQDAKIVLTKKAGAKYLLSINEALLNKLKKDFTNI